jgi:hypothetical protein
MARCHWLEEHTAESVVLPANAIVRGIRMTEHGRGPHDCECMADWTTNRDRATGSTIT